MTPCVERTADLRYLWRFFLTVSPVPPLLQGTLAVTSGAAGLVVALNAERAELALTPLLLLQLFAASSGFMTVARRGHYDLLFTMGARPVQVAVAHWCMSILPGVLGWSLLASIEVALSARGTGLSMLAPGTLVALLLVSTLPWAAAIALPRFAPAIGWLLALAVFATVSSTEPAWFAAPTRDGSGMGSAWAVLLYPPLLVGDAVVGRHGLPAAAAMLAAVGSLVCAFVWIDGRDIPLETAQ